MAEEEPKKLETETPTEPPPPPSTEPAAPAAAKPPKDVADDKTVIPSPPAEDKPEESKALAVVDSMLSLSVSVFPLVELSKQHHTHHIPCLDFLKIIIFTTFLLF